MERVLWTLLRWSAVASLRASILAVLVFLLSVIGRRWLRPGWTYALWLLVFLQLALPRVPASPLSIYNFLPPPASMGVLAPVETAVIGEGAPVIPVVAPDTHTSTSAPSGSATATASMSAVASSAVAKTSQRVPSLPAWQLVLASLWLAGIVFFTGGMVTEERRLRRKLRRATPVTNPRVLGVWNECLEEITDQRHPSLCEVDGLRSPVLFGVRRPQVLLPVGLAEQLTEQELRHIFVHELVHHRRWDLAVNWAASTLEALHWFNPLVWWSFSQMTDAQELACDAATVGRVAQRTASEYGRTLLRVLELTGAEDPRTPSIAGIARKGSLNRRRIQVINMLRKPQGTMAKVGAVIAAVTVVLAAGCGSVTGPKDGPAAVTHSESAQSVSTASSTAASPATPSSSTGTTSSSTSTTTHPAFAGTAYRSQGCISSAKVPAPVLHPSAASVVDCWKGALNGHDFTLVIWDKYQSQGYTYSSGTKTESYPVGNIEVYGFTGDYACYVQGAVNGGVINLTNGKSASDDPSNASTWSGCDRNPTKGVTGLPTTYPLRP